MVLPVPLPLRFFAKRISVNQVRAKMKVVLTLLLVSITFLALAQPPSVETAESTYASQLSTAEKAVLPSVARVEAMLRYSSALKAAGLPHPEIQKRLIAKIKALVPIDFFALRMLQMKTAGKDTALYGAVDRSVTWEQKRALWAITRWDHRKWTSSGYVPNPYPDTLHLPNCPFNDKRCAKGGDATAVVTALFPKPKTTPVPAAPTPVVATVDNSKPLPPGHVRRGWLVVDTCEEHAKTKLPPGSYLEKRSSLTASLMDWNALVLGWDCKTRSYRIVTMTYNAAKKTLFEGPQSVASNSLYYKTMTEEMLAKTYRCKDCPKRYQLCPLCGGVGKVQRMHKNVRGGDWSKVGGTAYEVKTREHVASSSSMWFTCGKCYGGLIEVE